MGRKMALFVFPAKLQGLFLAAVWAIILAGPALVHGFQIDTGSEDVKLRWDNTFRYTLSQRVKGQNDAILKSPNNDDGDRNFDVGIVSNRLDILSEFDAVYKQSYGVRFSGAGWYDERYHEHLDNNSPGTSNRRVGTGLSDYTKRYFSGPSGELLDAFAFGKFEAGETPVSIRAGRHTVYWGESMLAFGGANGISYAQSPVDLAKALAQPGVELKEIYRPLNQVSVQVQPLPSLSIAAQYFLQWEPVRFPESGSYLSFADPYLKGGESLFTGPGLKLPHGYDIEPDRTGDWGISARWSPEWLAGTVGAYYRNFSDKVPQLLIDASPMMSGGTPDYRFSYPGNISLYGLSFAKQILGVSVGAEVSYRHNMPLLSVPVTVGVPGAAAVPGKGGVAGARGETFHSLVNFLYLVNRTPLFDKAEVLAEFTYGRYLHVSRGEQYFKGNDAYTGLDHVTRDAMSGALNFTPTWYQLLPGVDMSMPLSIASGLFGVSAVGMGGSSQNGSYSAGLSFDILARYTATINYSGFFGNYRTDATGGIASSGDVFALLKDRDMVTLTLKTTF
ncbi:DUF1302 domain-containing protein [Geomonas azotofigens]|uniref:DUF1302 domain-containing protein n=1 Tax=Geomonas azotofigens TaxID=2843196 RepID=UPI001C0F58C1|nr:DUF1302 domain-containing protein [Geomonas azotofigens]MBU5613835.1 DUF1302 domain-containing protein [Geomonas azotofigens]